MFKPFHSLHTVVRGFVSVFLLIGLVWVSAPLLSAQKSVADIQSNLQRESFSRTHLRTLNLGILSYAIDHDGVYPAFDSMNKFRSQMAKYQVSAAISTCPYAVQPYAMNGHLAGKKRSDVKQPGKTLLIWSPRPIPGGGYLALDASGQVKRISAGEFAKMRRN